MTPAPDPPSTTARPGEAPCLRRFAPVRSATHCVYAPSSRLWGSPEWDHDRTPEENLGAMLPVLCDFIDQARAASLDGFVIELPEPRFGTTVDALAQTTHAVLKFLSDHDPADGHTMAAEIETVSWCFCFGGELFFVNTFGPCYPAEHSRYAFGADASYVLLQPRHSFGRVLRPGETVLPAVVRERIRRDYDRHDRGYDPHISSNPCEAWRVVRPLGADDPVVRWWELPAVFP